jgi:hypothetical protein
MQDQSNVEIITRNNIIRLDLTGEKDKAICNICNTVLEIPQIMTGQEYTFNEKKFRCYDKKRLLKAFQEYHFGRCAHGIIVIKSKK